MSRYIPILKFKEAEVNALKSLDESIKPNITPLLQMIPVKRQVERDGKKVREYVPADKLINERLKIINSKLNDLTVYMDVNPLFEDRKEVFEYLKPEDNVIPVIGLEDLTSKEVANNNSFITRTGVCIRVELTKVDKSSITQQLSEFLKSKNITPDLVTLLIDQRITNKEDFDFINQLIAELAVMNWKTIAFSSGSFPENMTKFKEAKRYEFEREDWKLWQNLKENNQSLIFSDYTVQYPIFVELPDYINHSFSVKYTISDKYVVYKGKGRNSQLYRNSEEDPSKQYLVNAFVLSNSNDYYGETFSVGDAYIKEKSDITLERKGSPQTWIQAAMNHHMTLVINQLNHGI